MVICSNFLYFYREILVVFIRSCQAVAVSVLDSRNGNSIKVNVITAIIESPSLCNASSNLAPDSFSPESYDGRPVTGTKVIQQQTYLDSISKWRMVANLAATE